MTKRDMSCLKGRWLQWVKETKCHFLSKGRQIKLIDNGCKIILFKKWHGNQWVSRNQPFLVTDIEGIALVMLTGSEWCLVGRRSSMVALKYRAIPNAVTWEPVKHTCLWTVTPSCQNVWSSLWWNAKSSIPDLSKQEVTYNFHMKNQVFKNSLIKLNISWS